jgi:hypothetical protein
MLEQPMNQANEEQATARSIEADGPAKRIQECASVEGWKGSFTCAEQAASGHCTTGQRALSQTLHSTQPIKFLVVNIDLKGFLHVVTAAVRWDASCRSVATINEHRSTNALKKKDKSRLRPESRGSEFFTWNTKEAVMGTRKPGMGIVEIKRRHISNMYKEVPLCECIANQGELGNLGTGIVESIGFENSRLL